MKKGAYMIHMIRGVATPADIDKLFAAAAEELAHPKPPHMADTLEKLAAALELIGYDMEDPHANPIAFRQFCDFCQYRRLVLDHFKQLPEPFPKEAATVFIKLVHSLSTL